MEIYSKKNKAKAIKALKELIDMAGGERRNLSDILGISPANVWLWVNGKQKVPIKHLNRIRILFRKKGFDEKKLRPDIYR
jgi:DNA-binding transcriptional regulator YdaS (Cro superfamily)